MRQREYAVGMGKLYPEKNFIGIDIKGARMWTGAKEVRSARTEECGLPSHFDPSASALLRSGRSVGKSGSPFGPADEEGKQASDRHSFPRHLSSGDGSRVPRSISRPTAPSSMPTPRRCSRTIRSLRSTPPTISTTLLQRTCAPDPHLLRAAVAWPRHPQQIHRLAPARSRSEPPQSLKSTSSLTPTARSGAELSGLLNRKTPSVVDHLQYTFNIK